MSNDGQSIPKDADTCPAEDEVPNKPRNAKPTSALQLGFYSRVFATDLLRSALLELVNDIHPNIHSALLTTINIMDSHWELAEKGEEGWISSVAHSLKPDSNDYGMQDDTLRAFADRAIDTSSAYRKLYDLGAFLGDVLIESETSSEADGKALQRLLRSFPHEQVQNVGTFKTAAESNPGNQDVESFLDEMLRGKPGWCCTSSRDEPAKSAIVRFVQAVERDLSQMVPASLFDVASPASQGRLTPSEEKIIDTIRQAGRRLTTKQILSKIWEDEGVASDGTTKNYLASPKTSVMFLAEWSVMARLIVDVLSPAEPALAGLVGFGLLLLS